MFSGGLCMSINESGGSERSGIDASKAMTAAPAFFRIADVMRITALSRATVYRRIADGIFPAPVHLGGRACGWTPKALQAWIDDPGGYRAPGRFDDKNAGSKMQPSESLARAGRSQRPGGNQASARIASMRSPSLRQASRFSSA
ncbi:AlpA family phage regulatory protein [Ramlibacter sp. 2FC]|uniref:helix-turn-helix transcriptional regulator n=1 Tax=Ramlibacter sp. 2FC TaxID=2502188 RepID=UPI0032E4293F